MATGRVNTTSLNVRSQPGGPTVIGVIDFGTTVTILAPDDSGDFLFISVIIDGETRLGWVKAHFIDTGDGGTSDSSGHDTPPPPGGTGIFSPDNWNRYTSVLGKRESDNNYRSVNSIGFCGRWQFGAGALVDVGYVRSGVKKNNELLSSSAWLGKNGVSSRDDWLSNKPAQDSAMLDYTQMHFRQLTKKGKLLDSSSIPRCAGLLAASHLLGVGGATAFVDNGGGGSDANGVTAGDYYKLLSKAFGGSGTLEP